MSPDDQVDQLRRNDHRLHDLVPVDVRADLVRRERPACSGTIRQTRDSHRYVPCGDTSAQSTSASNGPANSIVTRAQSAPYRPMISVGVTRFPRLFDIAEPPMMTMPWLSSSGYGSSNEINPMSCNTFVKKRE